MERQKVHIGAHIDELKDVYSNWTGTSPHNHGDAWRQVSTNPLWVSVMIRSWQLQSFHTALGGVVSAAWAWASLYALSQRCTTPSNRWCLHTLASGMACVLRSSWTLARSLGSVCFVIGEMMFLLLLTFDCEHSSASCLDHSWFPDYLQSGVHSNVSQGSPKLVLCFIWIHVTLFRT